MNKFFAFATASIAAAAISVSAFGADGQKLLIGVAPGPYGDLTTKGIKPGLEKKGYKVEVKEFSDWVTPNLALAGKDVDLNIFQHSVYLKKFSEDKGLKLSPGVNIPTAGLGLFSNKIKNLAELKDGASITIPNDPTNLARTLRFLAKLGLITLKPDIDPAKASERDIAANPKNLVFKPIEAAQIPRSLDSVDLGASAGNYAIAAGLKLADALALEELPEYYKIVVAVRTEDVDKQFLKDVKDVIESEDFKNVVEDPKNNFKSFQKPEWYLKKWGLAK